MWKSTAWNGLCVSLKVSLLLVTSQAGPVAICSHLGIATAMLLGIESKPAWTKTSLIHPTQSPIGPQRGLPLLHLRFWGPT